MLENTNKAILINSIINYVRMAITTILALLTTRYALLALGVEDFGLFSVLGSIISFIGIFNTIMLSTCNRFISVAIGKGDKDEINKQFNVNLCIFIGIALLLLLIAYPVGEWYVLNFINYNGSIENALMVYKLSIIGSVMSTLAIPYNGVLIAKERFIVFSSVDVFSHIVRFIVAYLLVSYFDDKLFVYTLTMALLTTVPALVYWIYCNFHFHEYVRWRLVKEKHYYKNVFSFSTWVAYGAVACVARSQGAILLVNVFFDTAMNAALGLANSLNAYLMMFANNLTQPMQPQITKSYTAGNVARTDELLIMSTKYSYMLMFLVSCPFFVGSNWILSLWLGNVPAYVVSFTILLVIDNLVQTFNSGISNVLFASGKIAKYQLVVNSLRVLAILVAYYVLKIGTEPYLLFYTYIAFSLLTLFATQWCLKSTLNYNVSRLIKESYIPSIIITLLFLPILWISVGVPQGWRIVISFLYLLLLDFYIGLGKKERSIIISKIRK